MVHFDNRRWSRMAGIGAGLTAALPQVVCGGATCGSCFICFGAGGIGVALWAAVHLSRRIRHQDAEIEKIRHTGQERSPGSGGSNP